MLAPALKGFEFRLVLSLRKCTAFKKDMKSKNPLRVNSTCVRKDGGMADQITFRKIKEKRIEKCPVIGKRLI